MITKVLCNRTRGNRAGIVRLNEIMNAGNRLRKLKLEGAVLSGCFVRDFQKKIAGKIMTAPVNLIVGAPGHIQETLEDKTGPQIFSKIAENRKRILCLCQSAGITKLCP